MTITFSCNMAQCHVIIGSHWRSATSQRNGILSCTCAKTSELA